MTTKIIWWLCALLTTNVELEPDTNGTPRIARKNVPISSDSVGELIPVPPWRRIPTTLWARLKHLFGIHTPLPTLRTIMADDKMFSNGPNSHMVLSYRVVSECLVCDKEIL